MSPLPVSSELHRKPVIGLLGGVGAGKSTVAAEFAALGCTVIDADRIGHELLADEQVKRQLRRQWGDEVFDAAGNVNRHAIASKVFDDPAALNWLNALLHPLIAQQIAQQLSQVQIDAAVPAAVLDAAVMLEAGWDRFCTDLVFVKAPDEQRATRVRSQRGWDQAAWWGRENSQISLDKKAARCKYTIDNSSIVSSLREQVRTVYNQILSPADNCRR